MDALGPRATPKSQTLGWPGSPEMGSRILRDPKDVDSEGSDSHNNGDVLFYSGVGQPAANLAWRCAHKHLHHEGVLIVPPA